MPKKILVLHTGGTISMQADTTGAVVTSQDNPMNHVSNPLEGIEVYALDLFNLPSPHIKPKHMLALYHKIKEEADHYDGVVITHGTDTLEETAYFLSLTVHSDKPVVLVGSMRPSTAISADGPANLYNGICAVADPSSKGQGVMVCMNNELFEAKSVVKTHTTDCATFKGGIYGEMGYIYNGKPVYLHKPMAKQGLQSEFDVKNLTSLPKVGIVYGYANCSPLPMQAFVNAKYDGIVLAGVGDGNFYKDVFDVAVKAVGSGINVVRASRVPFGPTNLNGEVDDAKYHFIASLNLNPQKARVLLMLALTKTKDWQKIQQYFAEY